MGNNQSQDSGNEHGTPAYNYHESVLRNAQQLSNANVRGYESDDQFFSADEGEESERSITPPRTRPESSSGEDFSGDSANDDDNTEVGAHGTSQASINESNINSGDDSQNFLHPRKKRTLAVGKSCGQCNVSRFQEHDSIGPELDRSQWDTSANNSSIRTTRQSTQRSQHRISIHTGHESGPQQTRWSNSPFQPINSPPYHHNPSQRLTPRNSSNTKRKVNQSINELSEEESDLSPKRRHKISLSPNKRRLAMLDESDSDSDNDERVTPKKKPRQLRLQPVAQTDSANLKRRIKEKSDEDFMNESTDSAKKRMFSLTTKKLNVLGEKRSLELNKSGEDENPSDYSPKIKNLKAEQYMGPSEVSSATEQPSVVIRQQLGSAFLPVIEGSNIANSRQQSETVSHSITKTMKMGNDAVRNSLGKVLPIRNSHHNQNTSLSSSITNVAESSSNSSSFLQTSQSDTGIAKGNTRLCKQSNVKSLGTMSTPGVVIESGNEMSQTRNVTDCDSENRNDSNTNANCSPFHNVVLTPPSSSVSPSKSFLKRAVDNNECDGTDIAMETDESQSAMDSMEMQSPHTPRQFATAKKSLTTAERFKHFFTEGGLKSNFKTLFSKRRSGQKGESQPNTPSNQTAWSLYTSMSSVSFGQSPVSNQHVTAFHSTSSPIDAGHSLSDDRVNFSPNLSNVAGASPVSVQASSAKGLRLSTSSSSLPQRKGEAVRKSASAGHVVTRSSPRLRRSRASGSLNTTNDFPDSSSDDILLLPQTSEFQVLHYQLSQTLEISLAMGDIAEELSSGIVNWTDGSLTHNATECSRRICAKAGALMRAGCNSYIENKDAVLEAPDVLTTPAGGRFPKSVKALLHVVSPSAGRSGQLATCLLEVNTNCLRFASERLSLDSLSMPLIGEGELPTDVCAEAFIDAVLIFITEKKSSLQTSSSPLSLSSASLHSSELSSICLVTADANVTDEAAEAIQARIACVKTSNLDSVVADIRSRYYGSGIHDTSLTEAEDVVVESSDRAKSGRPRVKRPRL